MTLIQMILFLYKRFFIQNYSQELDRFYPSLNIVIRGDQIRKLKNMHKSAEFDSKFISMLVGVVFDKDVLRVSSA